MEHTPTPLALPLRTEGKYIFDATGLCIIINEPSSDRAAFIVRACNAHDELVAALRDTRDMLVLFCKSEAERQNSEFRESNSSIITDANAVLAKVQA